MQPVPVQPVPVQQLAITAQLAPCRKFVRHLFLFSYNQGRTCDTRSCPEARGEQRGYRAPKDRQDASQARNKGNSLALGQANGDISAQIPRGRPGAEW